MKHYLPLFFLASSLAANAQNGVAGSLLDESNELRGDKLFRYVYRYDQNRQRASETIYCRERNNGLWGDERLHDIGNYTYQMDSRGRITRKEVKYTMNSGDFYSYRIDIQPDAPGGALYTRYEDTGSGEYQFDEEWAFHDDGSLAMHGRCSGLAGGMRRTFDKNGVLSSLSRYNGNAGNKATLMVEKQGALNDSTVYVYSEHGGSNALYYVARVRFDARTGRPTELARWSDETDSSRDVWTYDEHGRLVSHEYYNTGSDDDCDTGPVVNPEHGQSTRGTAPLEEPDWVLDEKTTYTYATDEVYDVANSWNSVFGFDGPMAEFKFTERGDDGQMSYVQHMVFNRDATGKLLDVQASYTPDGGTEESMSVVVDANGHITGTHYVNVDTYDGTQDISEEKRTYEWKDGQCVKSVLAETDKGTTQTTTYAYTYGDNSVTKQETTPWGSVYTRVKRHDGNRYECTLGTERYIREVQTEDVSFTRPDMLCDINGMTASEPVVISVKNRVVTLCTGGSYNGRWGYQDYIDAANDDDALWINTTRDEYLSVKREGQQFVCSDFDGYPVYVVEDGRLMKEYEYMNYAVSQSVLPQGRAYNEITYTYSADGRLAKRSVVSVDSDGKRDEPLEINYKYDTPTGITHVEAAAGIGLRIDGRRLGVADGMPFSVYTVSGQCVASGVASYTFTSAGVYIVKAGKRSVKLAVN